MNADIALGRSWDGPDEFKSVAAGSPRAFEREPGDRRRQSRSRVCRKGLPFVLEEARAAFDRRSGSAGVFNVSNASGCAFRKGESSFSNKSVKAG